MLEDRSSTTGTLTLHPNTAQAVEALQALSTIDDVIHQKARCGIMATLLALGEADFKLLKERVSLSDGNLSTHIALLEKRGYVEAHKEFVRRKPHTTYKPTESGRIAFDNYLSALERIIRAGHTVERQDNSHSLDALNINSLDINALDNEKER